MSNQAAGLTRLEISALLNMSEGWVAQHMQNGDLPRPGLAAPAYVEAYVSYRTKVLGQPRNRFEIAEMLGMSPAWVGQRMQAGDLPQSGLPASEYVAAFVAYRLKGRRRG